MESGGSGALTSEIIATAPDTNININEYSTMGIVTINIPWTFTNTIQIYDYKILILQIKAHFTYISSTFDSGSEERSKTIYVGVSNTKTRKEFNNFETSIDETCNIYNTYIKGVIDPGFSPLDISSFYRPCDDYVESITRYLGETTDLSSANLNISVGSNYTNKYQKLRGTATNLKIYGIR